MLNAAKAKLARLIKDEIDSANTWLSDPSVDSENKSIASARRSCVMRLANSYSRHMTWANRIEFLKACGLQESENFVTELRA